MLKLVDFILIGSIGKIVNFAGLKEEKYTGHDEKDEKKAFIYEAILEICVESVGCGAILIFYGKSRNESEAKSLVVSLFEVIGFLVSRLIDHRVDLYGLPENDQEQY